MIQNQEFINEFVDEAKGHLEVVEASLLKNEKMHNDSELINAVFRAVHSIKGTAGFFGLKKIVSLAHSMENVFAEIRNGKKQLNNAIVDVMLSSNDCLKSMVDDVLNSEEADVSTYVQKLDQILSDGSTNVGEVKKEQITVTNGTTRKFDLVGGNYELINDGIRHGHKVIELRLRINKDLLKNAEGPVKLLKKMQAVCVIVDSFIDHSEINSLDDVSEAAISGSKDVYLAVLVTTVLDREMLSKELEISVNAITEMKIERDMKNTEQLSPPLPAAQASATIVPVIEQTVTADKQQLQKKEMTDENTDTVGSDKKQLKVEDSVRVHVSVLNDLMNMASEMVLGRNQLLRTLEDYRKSIPGLSPILLNIDRLTSGMQEKIMFTRMQPMSNVFNKFPRIIRDLSKSLEKDIDLELEGTEVELDKSVIEALTDPLTHLVRNAADHGLETPDIREKNGKSSIGHIKLKAFHEGGYVNIDVIDDGAGIDSQRLAQKAVEKGISTKEEVSRMSEQELLKLIFKPGFSTAEQVSSISGRGVGMDVVRTNIEKLGGSIDIFTVKNSGTTIRLMLPLTLAIIQSIIIEVEGQKFALPQVNLKEIVRIKSGDKDRHIEFLHDSEVLRLRGKLLPIVHLADILGIQRTYADPVTGEKKPERRKSFTDTRAQERTPEDKNCRRNNNGITRIMVLQIGARHFGLAVDSIVASEETLVKPLPVYLKGCECYSGVTIMGDGKTAMILDLEGLIRLSGLSFRDDSEAVSEIGTDEYNDSLAERQNILLFKCTGNETYAIDLSMVSRIEEIKSSDIERIGSKEYIKYRGDSMRVIHPDDYLPVNRMDSDNSKKYILIPKYVHHPIGIIAEKIIDNINTKLVLNTENLKTKGILGTAIYEKKMILLLNLYELYEMADPEHYSNYQYKAAEAKSLLLVEDTPFFQRLEKEYLESAGYAVFMASNGKEALEVLKTQKVAAVISDIQMPVMDGMELAKRIREDKRLNDVPIIAVTSMTGDSTRKQALDIGFDYYEVKLDRDKLLKIVQQAMKAKEVMSNGA